MRNGMILVPFLVAACAEVDPARSVTLFYSQSQSFLPRQDAVPYCHGYGCRFREQHALTSAEWAQMVASVQEAAESPQKERENIKRATAAYEDVMGKRFQTHMDRAGTFQGVGEKGQLDCTDEAFNTTTLLYLLQDAGYLKFHTLKSPASRLSLWPHTTAVIMEKESGISYAVDSWFDVSAAGAHVVALDSWKGGWSPDERE